jgi:signal transduction histidine kinase
VQGLVDFARLAPPDRRPHDVSRLIEEAVGLAALRAEAKGVSLKSNAPQTGIVANVDRDQFLSLVTNLLFNGIEAAPAGGEVAVHTAHENGELRVAVTDTGPGIDPAVAPRLFTPFATTKPGGTGLGLSVARKVAADHGGTLTAANRLEGGACFTLTLPLEARDAEAAGR